MHSSVVTAYVRYSLFWTYPLFSQFRESIYDDTKHYVQTNGADNNEEWQVQKQPPCSHFKEWYRWILGIINILSPIYEWKCLHGDVRAGIQDKTQVSTLQMHSPIRSHLTSHIVVLTQNTAREIHRRGQRCHCCKSTDAETGKNQLSIWTALLSPTVQPKVEQFL